MKTLKNILFAPIVTILLVLGGCSSDDLDDAFDLVDGVSRKTIDTSRLGANAFGNDSRFGTPQQQYRELRNTLGIKYARLLFRWDDGVQPTPGSPVFFAFFDDLVSALPADLEVVVVVTGIPSWMRDSSNWVNGNSRETFVRDFFSKVVNRYKNNRNIRAWQVWNEPNNPAFSENETLSVLKSPENYVELVGLARNALTQAGSTQLLLNGATTAINQNFPQTRDYNRGMRDAGIGLFIDVYAIHIYGRQFENIVRDGGVADFVNGLGLPVWVTESGAQGVDNQLAYGEQMWPYLFEKIPALRRIYIYQFTEATPSSTTYGLKNLDSSNPVSDLYVHLRDRAS